MLWQVVSAVQYCHQRGIVHTDLKPENILTDSEMNTKLAHFGFSREFTDKKLSTFCGTVSYMAPEVLQLKTYDYLKVDVWSVGVVLYRMMMRELPIEGENFEEAKKKTEWALSCTIFSVSRM